MKENKLTGYTSIDENKIDMENLVEKKNVVTCEVYIQGETVNIEMIFKKNSFSGKVTYSQGSLEITGTKVKK